jgi:WD40 repeat protein
MHVLRCQNDERGSLSKCATTIRMPGHSRFREAQGSFVTEDREYRYDAFISYRHVEEDRTWAQWLANAIESFRVPSRFSRVQRSRWTRCRSGLGDILGLHRRELVVFRDEEELPASASLTRSIEDALHQSRFLIVVCSPRTPSSEWVNKEALKFRELGRGDRILALLIEGEPAESYPPALLEVRRTILDSGGAIGEEVEEVEPLAADVRKARREGQRTLKQVALIRLMACLLGCSFDELRQRERRRRRRRLAYVSSILAVIAFGLGALGLGLLHTRSETKRQEVFDFWERGRRAWSERQFFLSRHLIARSIADCKDGDLARSISFDSFPDSNLFIATRLFSGGPSSPILSPDRSRLLILDNDSTARIWDCRAREVVGARLQHPASVTGGAYIAGASQLVTWCADKSLHWWDGASGRPMGTAMAAVDCIEDVAFSEDGDRVLVRGRRTAQLWSGRTYSPLGPLVGLPDYDEVVFASISGNLAWILAHNHGGSSLDLVDARTGRPLVKGLGEFSWRWTAVARDGSRLLNASGSDARDTIREWEVSTGRKIGKDMVHAYDVSGMAYSPDLSRVLAWGGDEIRGRGEVAVWDAATGEPTCLPMPHLGFVSGAMFMPDSRRILSWGTDGVIKLWDSGSGTSVLADMMQAGVVAGVAVSRSGRRLLTWTGHPDPREGSLRLWDLESGRQIGSAMHYNAGVLGAEFSTDERQVLSWSADGTVKVWDSSTGSQIGPELLLDPEDLVSTRIPGRRNASISGHAMGSASGSQVAAYILDGNSILVSSANGGGRIWTRGRRQPRIRSFVHHGVVRSAIFTHGDSLVLSWDDEAIRVWDVASGEQIGRDLRHHLWIKSAMLTRDGHHVLCRGNPVSPCAGRIRFFDLVSGRRAGPPIDLEDPVSRVVYAKDGSRILTVSGYYLSYEESAQLWDRQSGRQIGFDMPSHGYIHTVLFSPDERQILTLSDDGVARLWDATTTNQVGDDIRHGGMVESAAFSSDGSRLLLETNDGRITEYDSRTGRPLFPSIAAWGSFFAENGTRINAWESACLRSWDAMTGRPLGRLIATPTGRYALKVLPLMAGSRFLTFYDDHTMRLSKCSTGEIVGAPLLLDGDVGGWIPFADDRRVLVWGGHQAGIVDVDHGGWLGPPITHPTPVAGARVASTGAFAATWTQEGSVRLLDARTGSITASYEHSEVQIDSLFFNGDALRMICGNESGQWLSSAIDSRALGPFVAVSGTSIRLVVAHDGTYVVTKDHGGRVRVWDSETGEQTGSELNLGGAVNELTLLKEAHQIMTWESQEHDQVEHTYVWDLVTGSPVDSMVLGDKVLHALSDAGATVEAAPSGEPVRLGSEAAGAHTGPSQGLGAGVAGMRLSPSGSRVLTWDYAGGAQFWDARTQRKLGECRLHHDQIEGACFSQYESRVLTWDRGGAIHFWELPVDADCPLELYGLEVSALTGTELTADSRDLIVIPKERLTQLRGRYLRLAAAHAAVCKFPEQNLYLVDHPSQ